MRKYSVLGLTAVVLFSITLLAQGVDVTGDWEMTMETRRGETTRTISFVQDGEKLTVTMEGFQGEDVTGEGTIKGNELEWTITRSTPRGDFSMTYTGQVEGDTMTGEVQMGQRGSNEWTAKRK